MRSGKPPRRSWKTSALRRFGVFGVLLWFAAVSWAALPDTMTTFEGYGFTYNAATGFIVTDDSLSFDAFINFAADVDSYVFAPEAGGPHTIVVGHFANAVDPIVAVYDADTGVKVGEDDNSGPGDDAELVLDLVSKKRYIVAVGDSPATTTGDVNITISTATTAAGQTLNPGQSGTFAIVGSISPSGDTDFYSITIPTMGPQNSNPPVGGTLRVNSPSDLTSVAVLWDENGFPIERVNEQSESSLLHLTGAPGIERRLSVFSSNYASSGIFDVAGNFFWENHTLFNLNIAGNQYFGACDLLYAGGDFSSPDLFIQPPGKVTFHAVQRIELRNGFVVNDGAELELILGPLPDFTCP